MKGNYYSNVYRKKIAHIYLHKQKAYVKRLKIIYAKGNYYVNIEVSKMSPPL